MGFDVEGARKAGYTDAEIASHLAQSNGFDLAGAKKANYSDSEVIAHLASGAQMAPPKPGIVDRITALPGQLVEAVTGSQRATDQTQNLPEWTGMPELNTASMASFKTGLGTLMSSPAETVKVIQANFPGVQIGQDEKGNYLLTSSIDGKQYAIPPGFSVGDIPRAAGAVAAFTPAGRAATIPGMMAASAGTQALIEGSQAWTGGDFSAGDVATAGLLAGAVPAAVQGVRAGASKLTQAVRGTPPAVAPAQAAAAPAATVAQQAPAAAAPGAAQAAAPAAQVAAMGVDDLGQQMRTAALGGIGSKKATQTLVQQAAPDAETVAAAQRLGILEHLQPDHVTTNQAFRQLSQLVKSQTGSEAAVTQRAGLEKVAERAASLIDDIGGTADVSTLNVTLRDGMQSVERQLRSQADDLYSRVRAAIPAKTAAPAPNTAALIRERAEELGGEKFLTALEKRVLSIVDDADDPATYARLDDLRRRLNAAKYGKAEEAFTTADDALRDRVLTALRADQEAVATSLGQGETWNLAQATAATYKGIQDDMKALFGKELEKSLAPALSGSVKKLGQGDTSGFARLMRVTPPEMRQEVTASGLASFFQKTARGGEMDFAGYAKWFDGLKRNEQSYAALMSNLPPQTARQLNDLARVSRGVAMAKGEFIATGKAINPKALEAADTLMGKVYDEVRRRGVAGLAAEVAGTASGAPGMASALMSATMRNKPSIVQAADKLIASPEFIAAAKQAGQPGQAAAVRTLAYSKPFTKYVRALGAPREMSNRERWILNAMQAQNNLSKD